MYLAGAKVVKKPNQKWASIYFKDTTEVKKFIEILNKKFEEGYK